MGSKDVEFLFAFTAILDSIRQPGVSLLRTVPTVIKENRQN